MNISNRLIAFFVILITLTNIISYISIYQMTEVSMPTALISSVATANLCLNKPPEIVQTCNGTATANSLYVCDVNVTDSDSSTFIFSTNASASLFTINSSSGLINFTPDSGDVRAHNINITVNDNSGCSNSQDSGILNLNVSSAGGEGESVVIEAGGGSSRRVVEEAEPEAGAEGEGEGEVETEIKVKKEEGIEVLGNAIKTKLKIGESLEKGLMITNEGNTPVSIKLKVEGVGGIVSIDKSELTLAPGESKIIWIKNNAAGLEPDVYTGRLVLDIEDTRKPIPIIVELETKEVLFKTKAIIPLEFKEVKQGENLEFKVNIDNLLDKTESIVASISIKNTNGDTIISRAEDLAIEDYASFLSGWGIPTSLPAGEYVLALVIKSAGSVSTASEIFTVSKPISVELPFGGFYYISSKTLVIIMIANSLVIIISIILGLRFYRQQKKIEKKVSKKRIELGK